MKIGTNFRILPIFDLKYCLFMKQSIAPWIFWLIRQFFCKFAKFLSKIGKIWQKYVVV
jgi:hypothetical protein